MENTKDTANLLELICISPGTTRSYGGTHTFWLLVALNVLLALTAALGNTIILVALRKESSLHLPSKILFRSLAVSDLCVGLFSGPFYVPLLMAFEYERWYFLCYPFVIIGVITNQVLCSISLLTITAISVDRLLALLLGLRYKHVVTYRRVLITVISCWTMGFGFGMAVILNIEVALFYSRTGILMCLIVSTCCYAKIYQRLLHQQNQIQQLHQSNGEGPLNIARYRKTVSSALWIQLTLFVCYLPLGISLAFVSTEELVQPVIQACAFSLTFLYVNSTLNPILYCWKIRAVRTAVMVTIRQMFCRASS